MSLFSLRPAFFSLGRLEVFAEGWRHESPEPLMQVEKKETSVGREFQLWLPGVHLVVCLKGQAEVVAGG